MLFLLVKFCPGTYQRKSLSLHIYTLKAENTVTDVIGESEEKKVTATLVTCKQCLT